MGEAAEHIFNRKHAAPALISAMRELVDRNGRTFESMDQIARENPDLSCGLPEWRLQPARSS